MSILSSSVLLGFVVVGAAVAALVLYLVECALTLSFSRAAFRFGVKTTLALPELAQCEAGATAEGQVPDGRYKRVGDEICFRLTAIDGKASIMCFRGTLTRSSEAWLLTCIHPTFLYVAAAVFLMGALVALLNTISRGTGILLYSLSYIAFVAILAIRVRKGVNHMKTVAREILNAV